MDVKSARTARSEATRRALLDVARRRFAERGFAGMATEEIVKEVGVTRGALYHHFRDKADLFRAIAEDGELELVRRVLAAADEAGEDPWERVLAGSQAFLDACLDPVVQRCLLEAPSVLGWEAWREVRIRHSLGLMKTAFDRAIEAGVINPQPVEPLAHMLFGALHEAALVIARASDRDAARREVGESLTNLLHALRREPPART